LLDILEFASYARGPADLAIVDSRGGFCLFRRPLPTATENNNIINCNGSIRAVWRLLEIPVNVAAELSPDLGPCNNSIAQSQMG
jgi:hypothetical protein